MDEQLAANRANWDERVPIHLASDFYDVEGWLAERPGMEPWEREALGDVTDLDVVHLQCHFGLDTLALADDGARVTGVDFSPAAVAAARDLADRAGLGHRARFVEADVLDASTALAPDRYDLVYVTLGSLCWLPDVTAWARQVAALLRPGGRLYLHDGHPLTFALAEDEPSVERTYFQEPQPFIGDDGGTYTDGDPSLTSTGRTTGRTRSEKSSPRCSTPVSASMPSMNTTGRSGPASFGCGASTTGVGSPRRTDPACR